jgi:hypothetical protein
MSAGKHVVVWPKVKVTVGEKRVVVERGNLVPDGVSAVDLENLTSFGAIAGVTVPDAAVDSDSKPAKVEDILAEVGDDKEKAQAALDSEQGQTKPRKSLVEKLQAVLAAE